MRRLSLRVGWRLLGKLAWEPVQRGCHFSWDLLVEKEPVLHRSIANTSWGEGTAKGKDPRWEWAWRIGRSGRTAGDKSEGCR